MDYGFDYIKDHGICAESDYTYTAEDGTCKASDCTSAGSVSSYTDVATNAAALSEALAK